MKQLLLAVALGAIFATSAFAHSPLKSTNPANGATVSSAQTFIKLVFGKPARVTKIVLVNGEGDKKRLAIPKKEFTTDLTIDADLSAAGKYEVQWRALSEDGHAIKGSFGFKVE